MHWVERQEEQQTLDCSDKESVHHEDDIEFLVLAIFSPVKIIAEKNRKCAFRRKVGTGRGGAVRKHPLSVLAMPRYTSFNSRYTPCCRPARGVTRAAWLAVALLSAPHCGTITCQVALLSRYTAT